MQVSEFFQRSRRHHCIVRYYLIPISSRVRIFPVINTTPNRRVCPLLFFQRFLLFFQIRCLSSLHPFFLCRASKHVARLGFKLKLHHAARRCLRPLNLCRISILRAWVRFRLVFDIHLVDITEVLNRVGGLYHLQDWLISLNLGFNFFI
jgi:hypothetical protein